VDATNAKQQSWFEHQDLMGKSHVLKNQTRFWLDRNPAESEFNTFANSYDTFQASTQMNTVLNSLSSARYTNAQYLTLLFQKLLNVGDPTSDADYISYLGQLNTGTARSSVLDSILNSTRFSNLISAQVFADHLYLRTLKRATIDTIVAPSTRRRLRSLVLRVAQPHGAAFLTAPSSS
jgi:hypothetical protein